MLFLNYGARGTFTLPDLFYTSLDSIAGFLSALYDEKTFSSYRKDRRKAMIRLPRSHLQNWEIPSPIPGTRLFKVPHATHVSLPVIHKPVIVTRPLGIHGRDPSEITMEIHLVAGTERSCPVHATLGKSRREWRTSDSTTPRRKVITEFVNLLFLRVMPVEQAPAHDDQFHLVGHPPGSQVALVRLLVIIGARAVSLFDVRHQRAPIL